MSENSLTKGEKRRREILETARVIFDRYGLKNARMVHIADELGINQAGLYYYFDNKEDIYVESIIQDFKVSSENRISLIGEKKSAVEKIKLFFQSKIEFYLDNSIYQRVLELDKHMIPEALVIELYQERLKERAFLKEVLEQGIRSGELKSIEPTNFVKVLISMFQGLRFQNQFKYFLTEQEPNLEIMTQDMMELLTTVLSTISGSK